MELGCLFGFGVDSLGDVCEDIVDGAVAVDGAVKPFVDVVVAQGCGRLVVDFQAIFDSLGVVVSAAGLLASVDHAVNQFVLRYFQSYYVVYLLASALQQALEGIALSGKDAQSELDKSTERINAKLERYARENED